MAFTGSGQECPEICVVTPIFERRDLVPTLLDTLRAQSFADWELVLVDDASRADIAGAVAAAQAALPDGPDPRLRLVRRAANGGPSAARNTGIGEARGRFIAFLDSDDSWHPEKLARQRRALLDCAAPDLSFCFCRISVVYPGGQEVARPARGLDPEESGARFLYLANEFAQCSAFFCGAALLHGPTPLRFDETLRQYEDHLFFMDLVAAARATVFLPETLSRWANDDRPDRMGASDDVARGARFVEIARRRGRMSEAEALAFRLRCLGPALLSTDRRAALRLALEARRCPQIPREAWAKLVLAGLIGPGPYRWLRERLR